MKWQGSPALGIFGTRLVEARMGRRFLNQLCPTSSYVAWDAEQFRSTTEKNRTGNEKKEAVNKQNLCGLLFFGCLLVLFLQFTVRPFLYSYGGVCVSRWPVAHEASSGFVGCAGCSAAAQAQAAGF